MATRTRVSPGMAYEKCPRPTMVQTLIFQKSWFDPIEVVEWLDKYDIDPLEILETGQSYRARLHSPKAFEKNLFRTIRMGRGKSNVSAVVGCPKPALWKKEQHRRALRKKARAKARKASRR